MSEVIQKHVENGIATIYLNRPEVRNALNGELLSALTETFFECKNDDNVRVIVLTGKGKAFSAGGDLREFLSERENNTTSYEMYVERKKLLEFFEVQFNLGKPTISAVNGHALAGGFGVALSSDFVIASEDALMGTTEINIGLFPMMIMAVIFRYAPRRKGMEYIFTGDVFKASKALEDGLINKVVPSDRVMDEAYQLAEKLASKSMAAMRLGRDAYYNILDMNVNQALRYLSSMLVVNLNIDDAKEGLNSFLEKREAKWNDK